MTAPIDYDFRQNLHTVEGPAAALPVLLAGENIRSILDVGCGRGTWLKAAANLGITDFLGVDGADTSPGDLLIPSSTFQRRNLAEPGDFGRRFDAAFCFEVAEHLDADGGDALVETLVRHSDLVYFSAAAPGQSGQHHVNCQPPAYWQERFNRHGFVCDDQVRWRLWTDRRIEPWYRQNIFKASRHPAQAGLELRLPLVVHPEMLALYITATTARTHASTVDEIQAGTRAASWYLQTFVQAFTSKIRRRVLSLEDRDKL